VRTQAYTAATLSMIAVDKAGNGIVAVDHVFFLIIIIWRAEALVL